MWANTSPLASYVRVITAPSLSGSIALASALAELRCGTDSIPGLSPSFPLLYFSVCLLRTVVRLFVICWTKHVLSRPAAVQALDGSLEFKYCGGNRALLSHCLSCFLVEA
ncbi:hypothetical protein C8R41DRAFT_824740, partial [Lentinula lateritia]